MTQDAVAFSTHDHAACISTGVEDAKAYCAANKLRFTTVRQRVLEILLRRHRAMGAYDVLDVLREEGLGSQPPVAYRALDFLVKNGFAHKIERLNAFVACTHPNKNHVPAFMICRVCNRVAEASTDPATGAFGALADDAGFDVERAVIEAVGVCPNCKDSQ